MSINYSKTLALNKAINPKQDIKEKNTIRLQIQQKMPYKNSQEKN